MDSVEEKFAWIKKRIHTEFVYDLIYGNVANIREAQEMLQFLEMTEMPNCVMLVSIDNFSAITADLSQMRKRDLRFKVWSELKKAVESLNSGLTAVVGEDSFVIVFNLEYEDKTQLIKDSCKIAEDIKEKIYQKTSTSISIGIGWRQDNIRNLNISFREAQSALEHRFFKGCGKVIHIGQVEPFEEGLTIFSKTALDELIAQVRCGDLEGAQEVLDEIIAGKIFQSYPSPELVQARSLEVVINLLRAALESGIDSQKIALYSSHYIKELFSVDTAQNISACLQELVKKITAEIKKAHSDKNLKLIQKAIQFIENNYSRDLSLEDVSRSVGLSTYYFSHLFKKETEQTFIEFLTRVRIENAKRLLSQTNNNVAEIARQVGYQDPKYFSRVFKNIVGIPPSKYSTKI